jgi:hypothetical protein
VLFLFSVCGRKSAEELVEEKKTEETMKITGDKPKPWGLAWI